MQEKVRQMVENWIEIITKKYKDKVEPIDLRPIRDNYYAEGRGEEWEEHFSHFDLEHEPFYYPRWQDDVDYEDVYAEDKTMDSIEDGYNYRSDLHRMLILTCYDDDGLEIMTTDHYNSLPESEKPPKEHIRFDVLFSAMFVDENLNCCLVDIKNDLTYKMYLVENKLNVEIPFEFMDVVFGGKRPYYYNIKENTVSLRFREKYEDYLRKFGFEKQPGREGMLTTHRLTIG